MPCGLIIIMLSSRRVIIIMATVMWIVATYPAYTQPKFIGLV